MAFVCNDYDKDKTAALGTACREWNTGATFGRQNSVKSFVFVTQMWLNLGNYSTAGTSGGSGTTIVAGGDYPWIG